MGNMCCEDEHSSAAEKVPLTTNPRKVLTNSTPSTLPPPTPNEEISPNSTTTQVLKRSPENYQSIKYLGKGTFGDVVLAEDKETGSQYAMKIIEKKKIKEMNLLQSQIIKKISQNDLFVRIHETFQNESKIYVVMEYLPRGDIYYYLKKKTCVFREDIIKTLVAEIIIGIELLHAEGVVYRELKPENILVTNEGHVKLGDYGLSRMVTEQKNQLTTFIGTLEYTAPEAIHGNYDKRVDIWAIGILMFELKFEENLFEGTNNTTNDEVESNIEKINIEDVLNYIVGKVSYDFRDVLIKLLQKEPEKRISISELKKHPFFQGIAWQDIPERKNPAPLREILESDHIKFRDPNNYMELAHRKKIENKDREFETNLFEFRESE